MRTRQQRAALASSDRLLPVEGARDCFSDIEFDGGVYTEPPMPMPSSVLTPPVKHQGLVQMLRRKAGYTAIEKLQIDSIRCNGGTQRRTSVSNTVVEDYAEAMERGVEFPPVAVFADGQELWLADGFQRVAAARRAGFTEIAADLHRGTLRDAILYSAGANATHGLQRTTADKRGSVLLLLNDPEWSLLSDREIAKHCNVSHTFVAKVRGQMQPGGNVATHVGNEYGIDDSDPPAQGSDPNRDDAEDANAYWSRLPEQERVNQAIGMIETTAAAVLDQMPLPNRFRERLAGLRAYLES